MKRRLKQLLLLLTISILALSSAACGLFGSKDEGEGEPSQAVQAGEEQSEDAGPGYVLAIALPDENEHKWKRSGRYIAETLDAWGYGAKLFYAGRDAGNQAAQIGEAVSQGVDCIILAAVDSYSEEIRIAVEGAKESGIPVIAYDRLVMDTEATDAFVAFDPYLTGRMAGKYLESVLSLDGSRNIEIFTGGAEDSSQAYFYSGAMDVLKPHIDAGRIRVRSGRTSRENTSVGEPLRQKARERTEETFKTYFSDGQRLDAVLASDDSIALGAIEALENAGYGQDFPIVIGVGCHNENILKLKGGRQSISVFTDERLAADRLVETADKLIHGVAPQGADVITYGNGVKIVPAVLIEPVLVDIENYKTVLIGGDYYSYTDLNPE